MKSPVSQERTRFWNKFPFVFTDELVFYAPENFEEQNFHQAIVEHFNARFDDNQFTTETAISLSRLPVKIRLRYYSDSIAPKITLRISMFENTIALLLFLAIGVFLFQFDAVALAITMILAGLAFYIINLHKTLSNLKTKLLNLAHANLDWGEPALWKKQQAWLKNPLVCPACGEPRNAYSSNCVNCGLYLSKAPKNKNSSSVSTSAGDTSISYQYQKKNEKNSR
ncbi:MAG: hypothetical protein CVU09_03430 [Bacteroidetes bacterium HGW-Bacteroidetes-4]|jgi:hypothetical protein|nr:MAG: hypothetical protein CVU09_03430 [Bacteroidetes bacterium HGW-Bacteroidetes-4]